DGDGEVGVAVGAAVGTAVGAAGADHRLIVGVAKQNPDAVHIGSVEQEDLGVVIGRVIGVRRQIEMSHDLDLARAVRIFVGAAHEADDDIVASGSADNLQLAV